jgi:hypothetical protein
MTAPDSSTITLIALLPLIVWRVIARFRRMVGRQRLTRVRPWVHLILFPTLVALLADYAWVFARHQLVWLAAGLAGGGLLAIYGLKKTDFEATPQGLYYTPHAPLGIALSSLFLVRIAWRIVEVLRHPPGAGPDSFTTSPFTLAVVGLMVGYYVAYAAGLVRYRRRVLRARRARQAAAALVSSDLQPPAKEGE